MPTSHSSEAVEAITMHMPTCDFAGISGLLVWPMCPTLPWGMVRVICTHLRVSPNWFVFLLVKKHLGDWNSLEELGSDRTCIT